MKNKTLNLRGLFVALAIFGLGVAAGVTLLSHRDAASLIINEAVAAETPLPQRPDLPIVDVVEQVSPGVLTVGAVRRAWVADPYQDFFQPFFYRRRQVLERLPYMGSGFLLDKKGHILTNFHVIENAEKVFITLGDGREIDADVLGASRLMDVAMLKVDVPEEELPEPLSLGDSDTLRIGETAMAFGNPFGNLIEDPRPTVTAGVISAMHRSFRPDRQHLRVYQDMIQTDAAINPGNSGGPLVDATGAVVGINTFIVSGSGTSSGMGFAIPINRAKGFVDEILEYGRLRPMLIDFEGLTLNTPRVRGVVISQMAEDGPAEKAGLEVGDVILSIDDRDVSARADVELLLASKQVGETVDMEVWRSGQTREVQYTISEAKK
ncbi:trypsin-like peptidase domain-containing protein [bacterium]|nr:trypsin-like peptidase domain-containing protein [bacterium]